MTQVYRSDTGQFVFIHTPTQTTLIDGELARGFERMEAFLRELPPEQRHSAQAAPAAANAASPRLGLLVLLVVLPFIWLAALHYSLASLVTDFQAFNSSEVVQQVNSATAEVEKLRTEVNQLGNELAASKGAASAPEVSP